MTDLQREFAMLLRLAFLAFIIGISLIVGITAGSMRACAHEATNTAGQPLGWSYPLSCCSLTDCRPAASNEVRETANGYRLVTTGEVVPYTDRRVKDSPSGDFHVCQQGGDFDKGRVLCLFRPARGF